MGDGIGIFVVDLWTKTMVDCQPTTILMLVGQ